MIAMHRRRGSGGLGRMLQEGLGILLERSVAAAAAEVIRRAGVVEGEPGLVRVHRHAADGVPRSDRHEAMIARG